MIDPTSLAQPTGVLLEPQDWFRATWRDLAPLPNPVTEEHPFYWDALKGRFKKVTAGGYYSQRIAEAKLAPGMSRREAHFWVYVMSFTDPTKLNVDELDPDDFTGEISEEDFVSMLPTVYAYSAEALIIPPATLLPLAQVVPHLMFSNVHRDLVYGFQKYYLPYLSAQERSELQAAVGAQMSQPSSLSTSSRGVATHLLWAALTGVHDAVEAAVAKWPDDKYVRRRKIRDHQAKYAVDVILGLGDPDLVYQHMARLELPLMHGEHARAWLAHTETRHLDYLRDSALVEKGRNKCRWLIEALGLVESDEVAGYMIELLNDSVSPDAARRWLDDHPELAIGGAARLAVGRTKIAESARGYLRRAARKGQYDLLNEKVDKKLLERVIDHTVTVDKPAFDETTTPNWLRDALAGSITHLGGKPVKPPTWVGPGDLPPIIVGDHLLNDAQVEALLAALNYNKQGGVDEVPHNPLVIAIKTHADQHQLDEFVWGLAEFWLTRGGQYSEQWALKAVGWLGGDRLMPRLTPLIREWAVNKKAGKRSLVTAGVHVLAEQGSDTAVLQLYQLRESLHRFRYDQRVDEYIRAVAEKRGVGEEELADRAVPDCGLNASGTAVFDYGPRQFRLVMGPDLTPMVRDERGKPRKDLPRVGVKDDSLKADEARAQWKLIKQQVRDASKQQAWRLEQALRQERRWDWAAFEALFVQHPLLQHLIQTRVWGEFDQRGRLQQSFRLTSDLTFSDCDDESLTPARKGQVGLV
ncbi:MAG: DUF4132 domain-containing protein, partial [Chloroflexi bacterium]|nr:DUF4132 domain-containing protein [Chloroflexota bacterium]